MNRLDSNDHAEHDPHGPGTNPAGPNELGRMPTAPVEDPAALHREQAEAEERAGRGPQDRPPADEVEEYFGDEDEDEDEDEFDSESEG